MQLLEIARRPENFPLGSPQSRAAARAMLKRIQADRENHTIRVIVEHIGSTESSRTIEINVPSEHRNR
jgi:hypothetical protein